MSFVKPLAVAAVLTLGLGLAACGDNEAETTADTGAAADTSAMSSTAPTTVNPSDPNAMGTMGGAATPGSPADTSGMGGTASGTMGTPPNNPPPTQVPVK